MRRVALLSVHACPLARLGGRDSGGMNVYVRELARELGRRGVAVDVFTRWRERDDPQVQPLGPNARVVHLLAGPIGYYSKMEVHASLPEFTERLLAWTRREGAAYDLVHSHYWLSAEVASAVRTVWGTPVIQMFHTLGLVKGQVLDDSMNGEAPVREAVEREAVRLADRIVAASEIELADLVTLYDADPDKIRVIPLGVDSTLFRPVRQADARAALGRDACEYMILFVGRIEQIKGIDVLLEAVGDLLRDRPDLRLRTCLVVVGGAMDPGEDGSESEKIAEMRRMARDQRREVLARDPRAIARAAALVGGIQPADLAGRGRHRGQPLGFGGKGGDFRRQPVRREFGLRNP